MRDAGGRALIVGGWVRDRLLGPQSQGHRPRGLRAARRRAARDRCSRRSAASTPSARASGLQGRRHRRLAAAARIEAAAATAASRSPAIRLAVDREAARRRDFTDQRDRLGSADRRVPRSVRRPRRSRAPPAARRRSATRSATTACACCARSSSRRASSSRSTRRRATLCRDDSARRSAGRARSGARSRSCCFAPRPSIGFALAHGARRRRRGCFRSCRRWSAARRSRSGIPKATSGCTRCMVIDQARTRIDDLAAPAADRRDARRASATISASRRRRRSSTDGSDRSITRRRASRRRRALLDRLNVHIDRRLRRAPAGARHRRAAPEAGHRGSRSRDEVGDGAFRRLAQKVDLELLARVAKSDCLGRTGGFDCSAMDWFLERARGLGVEHAPPEPIVKGRHCSRSASRRAARRRGPAPDLRAAARWQSADAGRRSFPGAGDHRRCCNCRIGVAAARRQPSARLTAR